MKKIEFRGISQSTGKWFFGVPVYREGKVFILDKESSLIEIKAETLGQFIKKDCRGNKIYEQDIIKYSEFDYAPSDCFEDDIVEVYPVLIPSILELNRGIIEILEDTDHIKKIGNFFDNPELLNKKTQKHTIKRQKENAYENK